MCPKWAQGSAGIAYTGIRPGEKLYEEVLFGTEDVRSTEHPKVLRAISEPLDAELIDRVDLLIRSVLARHGQSAELKDLLRTLVPDNQLEDARTNPRTRPSPAPGAIEEVAKAEGGVGTATENAGRGMRNVTAGCGMRILDAGCGSACRIENPTVRR